MIHFAEIPVIVFMHAHFHPPAATFCANLGTHCGHRRVRRAYWQPVAVRGVRRRFIGGTSMAAGDMKPQNLSGEQSNAALIRRIADNADRVAFASLFQHFAPRVKAYMRRLGANDGLAEDLAQEALLAVWRKASLFDPERAGAATWVFTIARNLRIDTLRRERPTEPLPPETERQDADASPGAEAELIIAERDRTLRIALQVLPPEQAQLVQLAFYEDKPHREIEVVLGIPLGTVKSRLRMAMQRLRNALDDRS